MAKILVVEDSSDISEVLIDALTGEHHLVELAKDGFTALALFKISVFDLIILDWMLPDSSGPALCSSYRSRGGQAPILFLTGRSSLSDKEFAFDAGSDDYLTKPFHVRELLARVRALLRRPKLITTEVLQIGNITLDSASHTVTKSGEEIKLFPKDFALLEFFMRHPNQLFSAEQLLDRVWRSDASAAPDTVRQCLMRLRKKLSGEKCVRIENVHGVGYRLET